MTNGCGVLIAQDEICDWIRSDWIEEVPEPEQGETVRCEVVDSDLGLWVTTPEGFDYGFIGAQVHRNFLGFYSDRDEYMPLPLMWRWKNKDGEERGLSLKPSEHETWTSEPVRPAYVLFRKDGDA